MVYGKLVDKTLAEADCAELAPYVYGKEYSSDVARRMLYGSRFTLGLLDELREEDLSSHDKLADEMREQKIDLQKARQQFFDQRREFNKLVANNARTEHIMDELVAEAKRLRVESGELRNLSYMTASDGSDRGNEAVLVFTDWHYGLNTSNIWNTYSIAICKERVGAVVTKAIQRIIANGCHRVHVVLLGDMCHGAIHTGVRVASEELVADQIMQVSEIVAEAVETISEYVGDVTIHSTYGNHLRTVQNKVDSIHRDNMERLIPWWLTYRLAERPSIHVADASADEFLLFDVCGHTFCAAHGDLDSVKGSPRLFHTLFQKKAGKSIEYVLLGDKHHIEGCEELGIDAMICGSLCGTDDYANGKRLYSTPYQLLMIVNAEEGVDGEYKIKA